METFQEFYPIAEVLNCVPYVQEMETAADHIITEEKTIIVITGMRSSGKTTTINRMVGSEVWEPGNMDDEEKPLRVSFEPAEEDERYQCVLAVNQEWNSRDALLFEFREEHLVRNGLLSNEVLTADQILFLISATAPFNLDEVNLLKKMKPLSCQVVVNGIDHVKEREQVRVKEYIAKMNDSLGLPPVIFMEDDDWDFGRKIRNILPAYMEQKEARMKRIGLLEENLVKTLEGMLDKQTKQQKEKDRQAEENTFQNTNTRRLQADCYTLRMDVDDYKNKAVGETMAKLDRIVDTAADRIAGKAAKNPKADIDQLARKEYIKIAKAALEVLNKKYLTDLETVNSSASLLGLPGWDGLLLNKLRAEAPNSSASSMENGCLKETEFHTGGVEHFNLKTDSSKILIGTGLSAAGFVLAPLPTIVSVAGGLASVGVGGNMYLKKKQEEDMAGMLALLKKAFSRGNSNIKAFISETAERGYGKISEALSACERQIAAEKQTRPADQEETNELQNAALLLHQIKQKIQS